MKLSDIKSFPERGLWHDVGQVGVALQQNAYFSIISASSSHSWPGRQKSSYMSILAALLSRIIMTNWYLAAPQAESSCQLEQTIVKVWRLFCHFMFILEAVGKGIPTIGALYFSSKTNKELTNASRTRREDHFAELDLELHTTSWIFKMILMVNRPPFSRRDYCVWQKSSDNRWTVEPANKLHKLPCYCWV